MAENTQDTYTINIKTINSKTFQLQVEDGMLVSELKDMVAKGAEAEGQFIRLIHQGKIDQFYSDRTIARSLGHSPTGNGFRPGLGGYPTPSLVNCIIESGKGSLSELISQMGNGLVIDQILGGGPDISGDFSINVDLGYRIENGEIIGRVKDTMVAGNVYTILKQILSLGSDR